MVAMTVVAMIVRSVRRRLLCGRDVNPCNALLFFLFFSSVTFLISAIQSHVGRSQSSSSTVVVVNDASGVDVGGGSVDNVQRQRRLQSNNVVRRKTGNDFVVIGDDEVQVCQMSRDWAAEAEDHREDPQQSATTPDRPSDSESNRDVVGVKQLFYVDTIKSSTSSSIMIRLNESRLSFNGNRVKPVRCEYRAVLVGVELAELQRDEGTLSERLLEETANDGVRYSEPIVRNWPQSMDVSIDHEFVYIRCRLEREVVGGEDRRTGTVLYPAGVDRYRRRNRPQTKVSEASSRHEAVRRHGPRLVGSVGLPDPNAIVFGGNDLPSKNADNRKSPAGGKGRRTDPSQSQNVKTSDFDELSDMADLELIQDTDNVRKRKVADQLKPVGKKKSLTEQAAQSMPQMAEAPADDKNAEISRTTYEQFIVAVHPVEDLVKQSKEDAQEAQKTKREEKPDVLVLVLDSVSRVRFERHLVRTAKYLNEHLDAVTLTGYNAFGDSGPANIVPMLTGLQSTDLHPRRINGDEATYVDDLPFVWNRFEQAGYVTLFAEDQPSSGTFQTEFHGFKYQPVHHYMRPFWLAVESHISSNDSASKSPTFSQQTVFSQTQANSRHRNRQPDKSRFFGRNKYEYTLEYINQFFRSYPNDLPKFAFAFIGDIYGDDGQFLSAFDSDLERFMAQLVDDVDQWRPDSSSTSESLRSKRRRRPIAMFLLSDHGPSYGPHVIAAAPGNMETRQPVAVVALKSSTSSSVTNTDVSNVGNARANDIWKEFTARLNDNAERLTTPLDVHDTLLDLINADRILTESEDEPHKLTSDVARTKPSSYSVFRRIPTSRTCSSAGIDLHWCTCAYNEAAEVTNDVIAATADWVVEYINRRLDPVITQCHQLKYDRLLDAKYIIPNDLLMKEENRYYFQRRLGTSVNFTSRHPDNVRHIQLRFTTVPPSQATFEASVTFDPLTRKIQSTASVENDIGGFISRLDEYGDQSYCITESKPELRKYCICRRQKTQS